MSESSYGDPPLCVVAPKDEGCCHALRKTRQAGRRRLLHQARGDEAVERRLVTMFKRQLKGFLLPPKIRQGLLYPLDDEEQRILDGMPIRQERSVPWMIHPKTTFRNAWDLCMVVMSFASVILVPLNIAYFERAQQERFEWRIFNIASDMLFFVDVIFNFRTGITMTTNVGYITRPH
ncbi:hypothetical protein HPB51_023000 [Rhipicephalus microplus]|uniref:Ion transport domain-containing protein n=1 Tax=Rhipicephalus microplus TaxID=6941 RepID=A0A9J6D7A8_RHIMP|nr:hypothetical protein HPB51_023000 [Rhipicephalus microplus]